MVETKDINDGDSLRAWLEGRQREEVVAIAHRTALRVLPVYLGWVLQSEYARNSELTAIPVLWSSLISWRVAFCPPPESTDEIRQNADAAAFAVYTAAAAALDAADASGSTYAAYADAAYAVYAYADASSAAASADAAYAAYANTTYAPADAAAYGAACSGNAWASLRADCAALDAGENISTLPLWPLGENPMAVSWRAAKALMAVDNENWSFWIKWYEAALTGTPLPCDLLVNIARIKPEDWEKGPRHVNGLIAEI